jgi:probable rRNA maturation factor
MIEVDVVGLRSAGEHAPRLAEVRRLCILAAGSAGVREGHLAVEFVDADRITRLNATHRDEPTPTDVLAFPIDGSAIDGTAVDQGAAEGAPRELGDVVICPQYTEDVREAIVHGVLHLVGMDHESDDGEMLARQRELLAREGA